MSKQDWITENLKTGEMYAGIILDPAGDYHVVLREGEVQDVDWTTAGMLAAGFGGQLPTRRELRLILTNKPGMLKAQWYWTADLSEATQGYAYTIGALSHCHGDDPQDRAFNTACVAIRRIPIE